MFVHNVVATSFPVLGSDRKIVPWANQVFRPSANQGAYTVFHLTGIVLFLQTIDLFHWLAAMLP
jgi:hypothetical protein